MATEYKNIYQKLHVIQQRINGLGKDKKAYSFSYVTGDKVLGEVKPIMNELGLLLKQEILSIDNERQDYTSKQGAKSEILSKVMMRFTWIDIHTGEKDENLFGSNGQNDWDKGVGSALTYGERYFILKFFHIATDEDDIDNPDLKQSQNKTPQQSQKAEFPVTPPTEGKPAIATNKQREELIRLLNNPVITSSEKAKGLTKVAEYTEEIAAKVITHLKKVITDREEENAKETGAQGVAPNSF